MTFKDGMGLGLYRNLLGDKAAVGGMTPSMLL